MAEQTKHSAQIRVYYEDTDSGGVVYYANYLKFVERARTELLRSFGVENKSMENMHGVLFMVRHIDAYYLRPAHLDDLLTVKTHVKILKNASVVFQQLVYSDAADDLLFQADVTIACVDANTMKPTRFPQIIKDNFDKYTI